MDIRETVKEIILKRTKIENISEDDELTALGLDSLDLVEVMLEIEEAFNIEFSNDEIGEIVYIKDVLKLIEEKITKIG